jgi:hypothetical protein
MSYIVPNEVLFTHSAKLIATHKQAQRYVPWEQLGASFFFRRVFLSDTERDTKLPPLDRSHQKPLLTKH